MNRLLVIDMLTMIPGQLALAAMALFVGLGPSVVLGRQVEVDPARNQLVIMRGSEDSKGIGAEVWLEAATEDVIRERLRGNSNVFIHAESTLDAYRASSSPVSSLRQMEQSAALTNFFEGADFVFLNVSTNSDQILCTVTFRPSRRFTESTEKRFRCATVEELGGEASQFLAGQLGLRDFPNLGRAGIEAWSRSNAASAQYGRARLAMRNTPNLQEAAVACREALKIDPKFRRAKGLLAWILADSGVVDEAITAAREALTQVPDDIFAYKALALSIEPTGNMRELEAAFTQARALSPVDGELAFQNGFFCANQGRYEEGISLLERGLALEPFALCEAPARAAIGFSYAYAGPVDSALEALNKVPSSPPFDGGVEEYLARGYGRLGQTRAAVLHSERLLDILESQDPSGTDGRSVVVKEFLKLWKPRLVPHLSSNAITYETLQATNEALLNTRLSASERSSVVDPVKVTPEITETALRLTLTKTNLMDRAEALFDWTCAHVAPPDLSLPDKKFDAQDSLRSALAGHRSLNSQTASFLLVAMTRSIGLTSHVAQVVRAFDGSRATHACAFLTTSVTQGILLDAPSRWFGVPHLEFRVLCDAQAAALLLSGSRGLDGELLASKLYPESPAILFNVFFRYWQVGDWEAAAEYSKRLDKIEPGGALSEWAASTFADHEGRLPDALAHAAKAISIEPDSAFFRLQHGQMLLLHGRTNEARVALKEALHYQVTDGERKIVEQLLKEK
ncbi:MAG: tetratricopeptide repeat protein [Verrucomicrobia bacterium]|nr:tetratricopeptide repeat protein [Verrucomicrobiota bacterium]